MDQRPSSGNAIAVDAEDEDQVGYDEEVSENGSILRRLNTMCTKKDLTKILC